MGNQTALTPGPKAGFQGHLLCPSGRRKDKVPSCSAQNLLGERRQLHLDQSGNTTHQSRVQANTVGKQLSCELKSREIWGSAPQVQELTESSGREWSSVLGTRQPRTHRASLFCVNISKLSEPASRGGHIRLLLQSPFCVTVAQVPNLTLMKTTPGLV